MFGPIDMTVHCNPGQILKERKTECFVILAQVWYS